VSAGPRIRVLPDALIDQIAAGEVVERPASAVRELLENALDAGSTRIAVDVEEGGRRLIRVVDDGRGIHPDDLGLAVTRHATSKIESLGDLSATETLGFRGEALPSIAAVSRLTVRSTLGGAAEGREITIEGGGAPSLKAAAPVPGTCVEVADLFYNTPARAKHLKATGTEWGHVVETVTDAALGWPGVHFVLTRDGRAARTLPPARDLVGRVRQVYPKELTDQLVPVDATDREAPGRRLTGLVARPGFSRTGREHQKLIVGGRCVRCPSLAHAVYAAYEAALPAGRHPAFFLRLDLPREALDVNVHPAKREVRFDDARGLHRFVRAAVAEALGAFRGNTLRLTRLGPDTADAGTGPSDWVERVRRAAVNSIVTAREPGPTALAPAPAQEPHGAAGTAPAPGPLAHAPAKVLGQVQGTFILVAQGDLLRVVDQHTAHERVLYERLVDRFAAGGVPSQRLLVPFDLALAPKQAALLAAHAEGLAAVGLEVEPFGGDAFLVRAVPEPLTGRDLKGLIDDLVDDLGQLPGPEAALAERLAPLLATMACHAAVKAGDALSAPQMERLVADLDRTRNPHVCPHGRAITATLDRKALQGLFDRTWNTRG
jgi:DNA mismatch repair protein MutL